MVTALVAAGADVNARDATGATALIYAAWLNKNPAVLIFLLDAGADPKLHDTDGKTAWDYFKDRKAFKNTDAYWRLNDARL
jgi:ankyrin repeat protein